MKKKGTIILIIVLIIALIVETILLVNKKFGAIPTLKNGEEVLVSFNDNTKISVDDIWNEMKDQYALSIVIDRIDSKILEDEYKDDETVERYVSNTEITLKNNYVDENGKFDEESMLSALSNYGYPDLETYLKYVRLSYMRSLATDDYAKSLITEKQINDYYKNDVVGDVSAIQIIVKPESTSTEDLEKAKSKAEEILASIKADIKSGTSKEDAMKKYNNSDDSNVIYQDLGYFNKGETEEALETAAYKLKKDELSSDVIKTSVGYHILLLTDKKEKDTLENLKDSIVETLAYELESEDSTLQTKALVALREQYGVSINDSTIQERYNRYINNSLNQTS